jgi:hypothetical protein
MTDRYCVTIETKSIVCRVTIADCWIPNKNEARSRAEPVSTKSTHRAWTSSASTVIPLKKPTMQFYLWRLSPDNTKIYSKSVRLILRKSAFSVLGPIWRLPYFWSLNIHIHRAANAFLNHLSKRSGAKRSAHTYMHTDCEQKRSVFVFRADGNM